MLCQHVRFSGTGSKRDFRLRSVTKATLLEKLNDSRRKGGVTWRHGNPTCYLRATTLEKTNPEVAIEETGKNDISSNNEFKKSSIFYRNTSFVAEMQSLAQNAVLICLYLLLAPCSIKAKSRILLFGQEMPMYKRYDLKKIINVSRKKGVLKHNESSRISQWKHYI